MTYREVARRLTAMGCQQITRRSGGSHRKWINPLNQLTTALPDWGGRDLKLGTIRAALRQLAIEWDDFQNS